MELEFKNGKVAIYARVSTADKQDYSRQVDELKSIANKSGYTNEHIEVFAETQSGYNSNRPELMRLIVETEENHSCYDYILTHEVTRIGRKPSHTSSVIERWTTLGIPLYIHSLSMCTLKNGKEDFGYRILLQVIIEIGHYEAEMFKMRSRSGLRKSAMSGKAGGGIFMPYGYRKDNIGYLVIDSEEAIIVQEIFELYSQGIGSKRIASILNQNNTPTKQLNIGKKAKGETIWSDSVVLKIITNPIYKGERRFKGEIFKVENIVTDELYDKCNDIRQNKSHRNYLTKYVYLLKDLMVCGICGRNYFAKYKPKPQGDKVYVCSSKLTPKKHCGCPSLNISLIESIVYSILSNTEGLYKYLKTSKNQHDRLVLENNRLHNELKMAKSNLNEYISKSKRLLELYIDINSNLTLERFRTTDNELSSQIKEEEEKIRRIENRIILNNHSINSLSKAENESKFFAEMKNDRNKVRLLFEEVISRIVVNKFDNNSAKVVLFIKINEVELDNPLHILVNLAGVRKNPKRYQYKTDVDIKGIYEYGEIWNEDNFNFLQWKDIPNDLILTISS